MASLGPDIGNIQDGRTRQFPLDGQVELDDIGCHISQTNAWRSSDWKICGPVDRLARRWICKWKMLSRVIAVLAIFIRRVEIGGGWGLIVETEWGIADRIERGLIFDGGVIDPASGSDAGLAVASQKAVQKAIGCGWAPVNSEARTEVVQRRLGDGTRQALVAREDPAGWGTRILFGLHSPVDGIETVLFLVVRLDDVPAHACIDGQIGPNAVGVLRENSSVVGHGEKRGIALLVHRCHSSQQIVRKTIASLSSVKCEGPIR